MGPSEEPCQKPCLRSMASILLPVDSEYGPPNLGPYLLLPCLGGVRSMSPCSQMIDSGSTRVHVSGSTVRAHGFDLRL